ncbi:hypothetical protein PR048_013404 [Dryococelus australis]|uniref:Uncharacterized protein n=1 Tax=Dryococelus australis TaxID=614101 RepID=A0ABQ9HS28_9NEOP|nr:hypothetical protein PR048_013404 [Dryococelus australis]
MWQGNNSTHWTLRPEHRSLPPAMKEDCQLATLSSLSPSLWHPFPHQTPEGRMCGWPWKPTEVGLPMHCRAYWAVRGELSIVRDILMKGIRMVIPVKLCQ